MKKYIILSAALAVSGLLQANNGYYATQTPSYTYQQSNRCSSMQDMNVQQPYTEPQGQNYTDNAKEQKENYMENNNNGGYSLPKPDKLQQNFRDNRFKTEADQALYVQIMNRLADGRFSNVQVMIANGSITLQGTVPTQADKDALDQIITSMKFMKTINNQVSVQQTQP